MNNKNLINNIRLIKHYQASLGNLQLFPSALGVLNYLLQFPGFQCEIKQLGIALDLGYSRKTINETIQKLEKRGLIKISSPYITATQTIYLNMEAQND